MVTTLPKGSQRERTTATLIDGDIHNAVASDTALVKYLPERWKKHHLTFGMRGPNGASYPRANQNAARTDAWPPSGLPPGSDLGFLRKQLLDTWEIDYGILNPLLGAGGQVNLDYGAALASAINDWQLAEWCEPEPRLRASVVVAYEDGDLAAAEIHRRGDDPHFAHILLTIRTSEPLGRRKYWKLYQAAVDHDLPIGIHFGGSGGSAITGAGWPSYYLEDHGGMPQSFEAQVISLVTEGVFERFPTLKIVLIEGGFAWLPPVAWRLDKHYKLLREEVPHLKRLPSEYIRDHFWLTTQPIEEPPTSRYFDFMLKHIGEDKLMFATDYPHWDFDAPDAALPAHLSDAVKRKIYAENALKLYRFS